MTSVRRGSVCRLCVSLAIALSPVMFAGCGGGSSKATSSQPGSVPTASLEQQFVGVVKHVQPQVAQIQTGSGLGSGVVFDSRGHIVTNAHVIAGGGSLVVTLADGHRYPASVVGSYPPDDLAVITIGPGHALRPAIFADSSKVEVGGIVLAAGNPLGRRTASLTESRARSGATSARVRGSCCRTRFRRALR
jgi:putative serine protease PepD